MQEILLLTLIGLGTALATGFGAVPVFFLRERTDSLKPFLLGVTIGLMGVASIVGLLKPAWNSGSKATVFIGLVVGISFLLCSRFFLKQQDITVGNHRGHNTRRSILVFGVLFVHSIPEGLAIGSAYAADSSGIGAFVILAIALQNIPEGTASAIPMQQAGFSKKHQFWAAVGTSMPQPVGAVLAYLLIQIANAILPFSLAFAAGAMLSLIAVELIPESYARQSWKLALFGSLIGSVLMLGIGSFFSV